MSGKILDPSKVEYLAFEGGGGKGVAYLGAVRALEDARLGILPVSRGRIKGISGASAGALTALFLAMGFDGGMLEKLLTGSGSAKSDSLPNTKSEFDRFFDPPKPGYYRSVNSQNLPDKKTDCPSNLQVGDFVLRHLKQVESAISDQSVIALIFYRLKADKIASLVQSKKGDPVYPLLEALGSNTDMYIHNLLFDRGIFPGFAVREFFHKWISWGLHTKLKGTRLENKGGEINFEQFHRITGIDLVMTGTNLTQRRSRYFSSTCTPKFPVAEAVAISMNLPILFKPVWVEAAVSTSCVDDPEAYKGFWVDGGVLNNLPIHAFDQGSVNNSKDADPDLLPLNPKILALRLTDGFPNLEGNLEEARRSTAAVASTLSNYLGSLMGTLLSPAEEGQVRTRAEEEQTIQLYTYDLTTLEFTPSASKSKYPQDQAEETVLGYFFLKKKNK